MPALVRTAFRISNVRESGKCRAVSIYLWCSGVVPWRSLDLLRPAERRASYPYLGACHSEAFCATAAHAAAIEAR
jgi:hypothetical protein